MPAPKFWAYAKMLPRLEAERQLAQVNVRFATADQTMEDHARMKFLGELEMATRDQAAKAHVATPQEMMAAGMNVIVEAAPERDETPDA